MDSSIHSEEAKSFFIDRTCEQLTDNAIPIISGRARIPFLDSEPRVWLTKYAFSRGRLACLPFPGM